MARSIDRMTAEANRLYWETDTSVADIAVQLDISRRALYEVVQPQQTGRDCATCGTGLVYENRSARKMDHMSCPTCASTTPLPEEGEEVRLAAADREERIVRVGAAALGGAVIGMLATLLLVKRR